jgi:hypothetical protein
MNTSQQERERLTGLYSSMSDEELLKILNSGDELTDIAQQVLTTEITTRGLNVMSTAPEDQPTQEHDAMVTSDGEAVDPDSTVTLRRFRDLPDALLAKGSLESAGIECWLVDDNMVRMDWFISNLLGGVKLQVRAADVEAAEEILNQPIPETLEVDGVGDYEQPRCPKCQSLDVSFRELDKAAYGFAFFGVPIPFHKRAWTCHSCHTEWEDIPDVAQSPQTNS